MAAVQAGSLLDVAAIADAPGEILQNTHYELSAEPQRVVFYILAVPGTQDVILTTLRPSEKATAVDISQSFYYLYYTDPNTEPLSRPEYNDILPANAESSPSTIAEELDDQLAEEIHRWNFPDQTSSRHREELHPHPDSPKAPIPPPKIDIASPSSVFSPYNDEGFPVPPPNVVELPPPATSRESRMGASPFPIPPPYIPEMYSDSQIEQALVGSGTQPSDEDTDAPPIPQRHKIRRKPVATTVGPRPVNTRPSQPSDNATSGLNPVYPILSPEPDRQRIPIDLRPTHYNPSDRFAVSPISSNSSPVPLIHSDMGLDRSNGTPPRVDQPPCWSSQTRSHQSAYDLVPPSPPYSSSPRNSISTPEEKKPLGPRPLQIRKDWQHGPQVNSFNPRMSVTPPSQQQGRFMPDVQQSAAPKRNIILIRRDPFSGSQSNIGTIKLQEAGLSSHKYKNSSFVVDLVTAGYKKYTRQFGEHSYECQVDYANGGNTSPTKYSSFSHRRYGSLPDATKPIASIFTTDPTRQKGYTFSSPWGNSCTLFTGKTGRSMKCKMENPKPFQGQNLDFDDHDALNFASVSELRFNLPLLHLASSNNVRTAAGFISPPTSPIKSSASSFFSAAKEKASFLRRSRASLQPHQSSSHAEKGHGRSQSASEMWFSSLVGSSETDTNPGPGGTVDRYSSYNMNSSSRTPSPPKYSSYFSVSKEEKDSLNAGGGGIRGKDVKLGKLIVEAEGLKMLDLVVAVNMGIWWQAWERSMK